MLEPICTIWHISARFVVVNMLQSIGMAYYSNTRIRIFPRPHFES